MQAEKWWRECYGPWCCLWCLCLSWKIYCPSCADTGRTAGRVQTVKQTREKTQLKARCFKCHKLLLTTTPTSLQTKRDQSWQLSAGNTQQILILQGENESLGLTLQFFSCCRWTSIFHKTIFDQSLTHSSEKRWKGWGSCYFLPQ